MNDAQTLVLIHTVAWPNFDLGTQQNMELRMTFHLSSNRR